jgi:hypothetical protein
MKYKPAWSATPYSSFADGVDDRPLPLGRSARSTRASRSASALASGGKLPHRFASLGNRLCPDEHAKLYAAINARIPMPTPDEQRAVQEENAKDEERFWGAMRDMSDATIEDQRRLIVPAEKAP